VTRSGTRDLGVQVDLWADRLFYRGPAPLLIISAPSACRRTHLAPLLGNAQWAVDRFGAGRTLVGGMLAFVGLMSSLDALWPVRPLPMSVFVPIVVVWGVGLLERSRGADAVARAGGRNRAGVRAQHLRQLPGHRSGWRTRWCCNRTSSVAMLAWDRGERWASCSCSSRSARPRCGSRRKRSPRGFKGWTAFRSIDGRSPCSGGIPRRRPESGAVPRLESTAGRTPIRRQRSVPRTLTEPRRPRR
jgi:hypothetical protein